MKIQSAKSRVYFIGINIKCWLYLCIHFTVNIRAKVIDVFTTIHIAHEISELYNFSNMIFGFCTITIAKQLCKCTLYFFYTYTGMDS